MHPVYCDGSFHKRKGVIGVGVICNNKEEYYEFNDARHLEDLHELIAIKVSISEGAGVYGDKFTVYNDDRHLVNRLNKKDSCLVGTPLYKKEFKKLQKLLKEYNVTVKIPSVLSDRMLKNKCHKISRKYLNEHIYL